MSKPGLLVRASTPWGIFHCWSQDLIGRTLIGHNAEWRDGGAFWGPDGEPTAPPAGSRDVHAPQGNFWDGGVLLPFYDRFAKPGQVAIEVGAYFGLGAVYLAKKGCQVLALEPQREVFELLCMNWRENELGSGAIYPVPECAWDETCTMSIGVPVDYSTHPNAGGLPFRRCAGGGVYFPVSSAKARPLDKLLANIPHAGVCLIKSDAQGADLRVMKGATGLIARWRPGLLLEYEADLAAANGDTWDAYADWMWNLPGYVWWESPEVRGNWMGVPQEGPGSGGFLKGGSLGKK